MLGTNDILANNFLTGNVIHPCEKKPVGKYCHPLTKKMGNNLKPIMKVMRFAMGRSRNRFNVTLLMKSHQNHVTYNLSDEIMDNQQYSLARDLHTIMPWCGFKEIEDKPHLTR